MKIFRFILVLALIFIFDRSNAQLLWKKGYVLLASGDTVKGEIKVNPKKEFDFYSKVMVKKSEDEKKTFNPAKVKEFCFDETRFVSRQVEGENSFVKCLALGAVNLYEHQYEWQSGNSIVYKSEFFIEKANSSEMVRVKSGHFRKIVEQYMGDNAGLLKDVQDKKYDFDQLAEVVQAYNTWVKTQKG
ncbi:MAG TPA: hypothetical protein VGO45_11055 [Bacteroidia bacterium]|nr:hypothetical protein [Bacteroidia bacterium]